MRPAETRITILLLTAITLVVGATYYLSMEQGPYSTWSMSRGALITIGAAVSVFLGIVALHADMRRDRRRLLDSARQWVLSTGGAIPALPATRPASSRPEGERLAAVRLPCLGRRADPRRGRRSRRAPCRPGGYDGRRPCRTRCAFRRTVGPRTQHYSSNVLVIGRGDDRPRVPDRTRNAASTIDAASIPDPHARSLAGATGSAYRPRRPAG